MTIIKLPKSVKNSLNSGLTEEFQYFGLTKILSKCHLTDQIFFQQKQNTFIKELTAMDQCAFKMLNQIGPSNFYAKARLLSALKHEMDSDFTSFFGQDRF